VLPFRSILSRIIFLHIVALILVALLMPLVLYVFLSSDVRSLQRRAMSEQVGQIAQHLTRLTDGNWSLELTESLRHQYSEAYGRYFYTVLDGAGHILFSSRRDGSAVFPISIRSSDIEFCVAQRDGRTIEGIDMPIDLDGQKLWVQVAEDLSHRDVLVDDVLTNFIPKVAWTTVPVLFLLLLTDLVIFQRAVQPLLLASERAKKIGPTRIDVRLPEDDMPDEIRPLVNTINKALDRLEDGFRRQRGFTADVAHELRTPLAILRMRIDTLSEHTEAAALRRDVESMTRVIGQLLDAAEVETLVVEPTEFADLHEVASEIAEFMAPLALARNKTITLAANEKPVKINGNAELLRRALRNLVENALNHTPENTSITIVVGADGTVSVLDEGKGIDESDRERIFERFWPRDRRQAGSAGLGLSIVKRIVEAHGGTITVRNRPSGGAEFSMQFGGPLTQS